MYTIYYACTLYIMHVHLYNYSTVEAEHPSQHAGTLCYELQFIAACLSLTTMQGLNFAECGATNPVAVEECLHMHAPARGMPPTLQGKLDALGLFEALQLWSLVCIF